MGKSSFSNCIVCGKPTKNITSTKDWPLDVYDPMSGSFCSDRCLGIHADRVKGLEDFNRSLIFSSKCSSCQGTGKIKGYKCCSCDGSGKR